MVVLNLVGGCFADKNSLGRIHAASMGEYLYFRDTWKIWCNEKVPTI